MKFIECYLCILVAFLNSLHLCGRNVTAGKSDISRVFMVSEETREEWAHWICVLSLTDVIHILGIWIGKYRDIVMSFLLRYFIDADCSDVWEIRFFYCLFHVVFDNSPVLYIGFMESFADLGDLHITWPWEQSWLRINSLNHWIIGTMELPWDVSGISRMLPAEHGNERKSCIGKSQDVAIFSRL